MALKTVFTFRARMKPPQRLVAYRAENVVGARSMSTAVGGLLRGMRFCGDGDGVGWESDAEKQGVQGGIGFFDEVGRSGGGRRGEARRGAVLGSICLARVPWVI